jgi:hypothetical protein
MGSKGLTNVLLASIDSKDVKERFFTAQADAFARAKAEEKIGLLGSE